ncbi:alpha-hydroxy acid oxidase [Amycolatopsis sp. NPDC051903]|uniref:alpha-hydroxy acid oxidase n=1 Tax=Amycolatopsis sp. NPDC051903 TaxID=3363936 RepID=UPI00378C38D7
MSRAGNVAELRDRARRRLPRPVFDLIEGGAEDEVTVRRNVEAFRATGLLPSALAVPGERDTSVRIFGDRVASPILLAPTGAARVLHGDAEVAVARAAAARGTVYVQGMVASFTLEQVAAAAPGPRWYQLYLWPDRAAVRALLDRVAAAGYRALVVTVDSAVFGNRERDRRNRFTVPMRFGPRMALHCAMRPSWAVDIARGHLRRRGSRHGRVTPHAMQRDMLRSLYPVTARDLADLRAWWSGPLVVKGVLRPADCRVLLDHGADGIVVSNHGGRQLDRAPATIEALGDVVAEVAGRAEVFLDGGVRRGTDVLAALATGARAVLIGRPYLYGLAAGGQAGVERVVQVLTEELDRAMALTGCARLEDVDHRVLATPLAGAVVADRPGDGPRPRAGWRRFR